MLTQCKTCNREISRKAITCPHCGHSKKRRIRSVLMILAILFIVFHEDIHQELDIPRHIHSLFHGLTRSSHEPAHEATPEEKHDLEQQRGQATQQGHEPEGQSSPTPDRAVAPTDDSEANQGQTEDPQANREEKAEPSETATMDPLAPPLIDKINVMPAHQADEWHPDSDAPGEEVTILSKAILQRLEPEIQMLAQHLKYSYEQQDNNGLRAMFYRDWEEFFQTADTITAVVRLGQPRVSSSNATVDVQVELNYQDEHKQNQHNTSTYTWQLAYKQDAWMLTGVTVLP